MVGGDGGGRGGGSGFKIHFLFYLFSDNDGQVGELAGRNRYPIIISIRRPSMGLGV